MKHDQRKQALESERRKQALESERRKQALESERRKQALESERRKRALESERRRICHEISTYPTPIAGCDVQFNQLLSDRRTIVRKLGELIEPAEPKFPGRHRVNN